MNWFEIIKDEKDVNWFEIIKYGSMCVLFSRILHSDIDKLSEWLSV